MQDHPKMSPEQVGSSGALAGVVRHLEIDPISRASFSGDPRGYLSRLGVPDVPVQLGASRLSLFDLLESVERDARVAVARTIAVRGRVDESNPDRSLIVPVAAVALVAAASLYVAANVIIYANLAAGANAGAMANVRGQTGSLPACAHRVVLSGAYVASPVGQLLSSRGYSAVRQAALLKTLLESSDPVEVHHSSSSHARVTWAGHELELELTTRESGIIEVGEGRLIAEANA
ncbi:hypothetical protein [Cellulomonas sp. IC4_254]|uniref:hypothetical protein n=1 Tax=Cellulomonas sp. IC4_254 TaxID=2714040 RepID=UPI0014240868|nr:hypothetical protein [Cellulomonas sp. IC4_254]NHT17711.1 hypothetical protein [Cellulomonas sp. IC4_254]